MSKFGCIALHPTSALDDTVPKKWGNVSFICYSNDGAVGYALYQTRGRGVGTPALYSEGFVFKYLPEDWLVIFLCCFMQVPYSVLN